MKKLMFAAAAIAAGVAVADVTSANVVGYAVKDDISLKMDANKYAFTLMGLPFKSMKANGNWSLNDLAFSKLTGVNLKAGESDQIWLWVDKGDGNYDYELWRYRNATYGWVSVSSSSTKFDTVHSDGLPAGTAFWFAAYNPDEAVTLNNSGEVGAADREVTLQRGKFQFVSYPFPTNLKLNDPNMMDSSNCVGVNLKAAESDQIWFWVQKEDGTWDYELWRYRNATYGWVSVASSSTKFESVHPNGVSVGAGFWYQSYDNGGSPTYTIKFKSPLAKPAAE